MDIKFPERYERALLYYIESQVRFPHINSGIENFWRFIALTLENTSESFTLFLDKDVVPNKVVIDKINDLRSKGVEIILFSPDQHKTFNKCEESFMSKRCSMFISDGRIGLIYRHDIDLMRFDCNNPELIDAISKRIYKIKKGAI